MAEGIQFKLRLEEQLVERLHKLGARCGFESGNKFATAALDNYAELLAELLMEQKDGMKLLRKRQREQLLGKVSQESGSARRK